MKEKVLSVVVIVMSVIMLFTLSGCADIIATEQGVLSKAQVAQANAKEAEEKLTEQEKDMFNNRFTSYEGSSVNGSRVTVMLTDVLSSNAINKSDKTKIIKVTLKDGDVTTIEPTDTESEIKDIKNKIRASRKYDVSVEYNEQGLVSQIIIKE